MRRLGAPPEPRKYTPHVTLARLRGAQCGFVAAYLGDARLFPAAAFHGGALRALFVARFVGGGPYIVEAEYPLQAQAPAVAITRAVGL